ncbi:spore germination protein GerPB [Tepidibacillus fermentans]|uniref:Spore germination protein PB n=1 Tax=Tepidibacillus fermentans TaxID=1281767 RepID=A0A4R3K911_9BACI|nr:spore germination protein GerPB [Tepidibacillus fermentans]TCS79417.1 spore germination protein PB [Tepidibacillus fermentans]
MNIYVHQNIMIHQIRIQSIGNSSVFQIGSAGVIKPLSNIYNTGGFTGPIPSPRKPQIPLGPTPPSLNPDLKGE